MCMSLNLCLQVELLVVMVNAGGKFVGLSGSFVALVLFRDYGHLNLLFLIVVTV